MNDPITLHRDRYPSPHCAHARICSWYLLLIYTRYYSNPTDVLCTGNITLFAHKEHNHGFPDFPLQQYSYFPGLVMGRRWWAGPARQFFRGWAAARPRPSHFQKFPARPGPAHHFFKSLGPPRPGPSHSNEAHKTRALYGSARQLRGPARGFEGPAHVLLCTKRCRCIR